MFENLPLYEGKYAIRVGEPNEPYFYYFDYDERSNSVNMDFQHFHSFFELFMLLDDDASHILEGKLYPLQMYDLVLLRPALLHKSYYPVGAPKKRLIVNFAYPEELCRVLPELRTVLSVFDAPLPIYRFEPDVQKLLFGCLNTIFSGGKNPGEVERLRTHQAFVEFLTVVYQNRGKNLYHVSEERGTLSDKMYDVCACIHAHYQEALTLEELAKRFFISPYYLSHQFKQITHFGLNEYIQRTRVRIAQQQLIFTDHSMARVAEESGFHSFSQFNRVFRKICGASPSEYRRDNKRLMAESLGER